MLVPAAVSYEILGQSYCVLTPGYPSAKTFEVTAIATAWYIDYFYGDQDNENGGVLWLRIVLAFLGTLTFLFFGICEY